MRPLSIEDQDLIDALSRVISRHGFEGASLQMLSEAAGLKRASLYHRFPGGKSEILSAALERAGERFEEMLAPAYDATETPQVRATAVAERINTYYDGGSESCLIVAMTLNRDDPGPKAAPCIEAWTGAFARIAIDAGASPEEAAIRAQDTVAQIEGALVLASTTGDTTAFERALGRIPGMLNAT